MRNRFQVLFFMLFTGIACMMSANVRAQDGIISGNVKDAETGEPMRSVTVRLKDTKKGLFLM